MIDIHTHIMHGVDDGAGEINESIRILKNAKLAGFTGVILTPHYIEGSYEVHNDEKLKLFNELKSEINSQGIDIDIYLGNEVFITENIETLLDFNKVESINNSRYMLIELPFYGETSILQNCIFRLFSLGYTPIIAHPERYHFVQKDPNILIDYIEQGVLFQINSGSLLGNYGKKAQKISKILLRNNMIHFIATDTHSSSSSYNNITKICSIVSKLTSKDNFYNLILNNPKDVLNNKKIIITEATEYRKSLFEFFK